MQELRPYTPLSLGYFAIRSSGLLSKDLLMADEGNALLLTTLGRGVGACSSASSLVTAKVYLLTGMVYLMAQGLKKATGKISAAVGTSRVADGVAASLSTQEN